MKTILVIFIMKFFIYFFFSPFEGLFFVVYLIYKQGPRFRFAHDRPNTEVTCFHSLTRGEIRMKTSHRIKALRGVDVLQDKVVEEVLEAYYFLRTTDEIATINATLAIISEYKDMTSIFCAHCKQNNFCDNCFPMKKREVFTKIEDILKDQLENLPDIYLEPSRT